LAKVAALSRRRNGFETRMSYQNNVQVGEWLKPVTDYKSAAFAKYCWRKQYV
jgi:hypothetical protein